MQFKFCQYFVNVYGTLKTLFASYLNRLIDCLVFEGDEKIVHLSARSEEERDGWIEFLHIASYECLHMQLRSLREQIQARTGRDPIESPEPSALPEYNSGK